MRYHVLKPFKVKTPKEEIELKPRQVITLSHDKAIKLLSEGKITPVEKVAYKVYSEILQTFLWVVYGPKDMSTLRDQGITEAIYIEQEIAELKKLPKETLKVIHEVKEVFPMSTIEKVNE